MNNGLATVDEGMGCTTEVIPSNLVVGADCI